MTNRGATWQPASTAARVARAAWFFGNAYEAAVGVPQLIASADRQVGLLAAGSPVRYFAPVAPAAVGGTAAVLVRSWRTVGVDRRAVAAATATFGAALALSALRVHQHPATEGRSQGGGAATADLALAPG